MPLYEGARDIETKTKTRIGIGLVSYLIEALKDVLVMFVSNTDAKILYGNLNLLVSVVEMDNHAVCPWRILDSIGEQISEHLSQTVSISVNLCIRFSLHKEMMGRAGRLH